MTLYAGESPGKGDVRIGPPAPDAIQYASKASDVVDSVTRWLAAAQERDDVYYFSIFQDDALVGQILLHDINRERKESLVAYHLFEPHFRGRVIGTIALALLQELVVETTDLQRLIVITSDDNLPSQRIAQKCGFTQVGSSRENPVHGMVFVWGCRARPVASRAVLERMAQFPFLAPDRSPAPLQLASRGGPPDAVHCRDFPEQALFGLKIGRIKSASVAWEYTGAMLTTKSPDVQRMLKLLQTRIQDVLRDNLVGLYLTGSLVTGDFDEDVSDLDLVAVTARGLKPAELDGLEAMHREIAATETRWDNRIEVVYLTTEALRTYRTRTSTIAVTSPGEPFHTKDAGIDWLINWYVVREKGVTLFGPTPEMLIEPISGDELIQAVEDSARWWRDRVENQEPWQRNAQVYAILTMCRALYTFKTGDFTSKRRAALWAETAMPEWAPVIRRALVSWRDDWYRKDVDHGATHAETTRFVNAVIDEIVG